MTKPFDINGPIRIAYLTYRGKPHVGGQGVYSRHLTKALADLGPLAGTVAAVGIGLTGAAQAAAIAAQPPPAHMGDPLAPDERRVSGRRVLATEAVLDSATTRRLGGEDGLRAAMRGGSSAQPVQVNLTYKHLDREVARLMRSNSRTRRAVRS